MFRAHNICGRLCREAAKKPPRARYSFPVGLGGPSLGTEGWDGEGWLLHCRFDSPTCSRSTYRGTKAKPLASLADGFAVCAGRSRQVLLQPAEKNLSKRARQRALPRQIRQISIRWSGWISPLLVRDFSFRHPNDAVQQHDPIGGQGKAVGSVADGFAILSCYCEFPNCKVFALWFHAI